MDPLLAIAVALLAGLVPAVVHRRRVSGSRLLWAALLLLASMAVVVCGELAVAFVVWCGDVVDAAGGRIAWAGLALGTAAWIVAGSAGLARGRTWPWVAGLWGGAAIVVGAVLLVGAISPAADGSCLS